ncbi:AMIN-like domain-containing (lipo)protein [Blastococcus sp. SYSU DS0539]
MRTRSQAVLPALVTSLIALSGCAGGSGAPGPTTTDSAAGTAPATSTTTATTAPATDPGTEPATGGAPFDADTEPDTGDASSDARVTVRDVRVGTSDGYDRVVFEVAGAGTPGWDVRYVDEASAPGSGAAIEVAGDAVLQVQIIGAGYPYDTGVEEYSGPDPLTAPDTGAVTEVLFEATYEGVTTAFIGTGDRTPFRVHLLEDPARVVVDVRHAG